MFACIKGVELLSMGVGLFVLTVRIYTVGTGVTGVTNPASLTSG